MRSVTGPRSLRRLKRDVDLFLCGSDQLWNVRDHLRPFEFLGFADGCRKAAFATSIGTLREAASRTTGLPRKGPSQQVTE